MTETPVQILLVTPVWNDSTRLSRYGGELAAALAASPLPIRWVIADDGSETVEHGRLIALRDRFAAVFPHIGVHFAASHRGKGAVIREAWTLEPDAEWLAFVDADGSVPAGDMLRLIARAVECGRSVIGIRKRTEATRIVESPWRGFLHRGFILTTHMLLGLKCEDPQCGGKVLHGGQYRRVAPLLREDGWAFDSELLAALHRDGSDWLEIPINWEEKKGGKVKPLRDAWLMLAALFRIRRRLR
jgi:hypothetical protein